MTIDQALQLAQNHQQAGNLPQAESIYRQILATAPLHPDAHHLLGVTLFRQGHHNAGIELIRKAIELKPNYPEAYTNLGFALKEQGHFDQAIAAYQSAIQLKPEMPEAHNNLGNALKHQGQLEQAIAAYQTATRLKPDFVEAHSNLGIALQDQNQLDQAIAAFQNAIRLKPDFAEPHWNLACAQLLAGDFENGWKEFEWRWRTSNPISPPKNFSQPLWDGSNLAGRTILLHAEQGIGDTLQFIRYLPLVTQRGRSVIVECQPELHRLLQANAAQAQIVPKGQPLPPFEVHCPLLSLPLTFQTTLQNIPHEVPYLRADETTAAKWRDRFADNSQPLKVGLAWAGNPAFKTDHLRSPRQLSLFAPLAKIKNAHYISLQKGEAAKQSAHPPPGLNLTDWAAELTDFADTAALIANLDLVISSDTAVAHLAGAMGKPVWILLPFSPDWRWLLNRTDSPWYPTMRLFRQTKIGQWSDVIEQLAAALSAIAPGSSP